MIGIILWSWLAVGFLVGVKFIYIDKGLTEEKLQESVKNMRAAGKEVNPVAVKMARSKGVVLTMNTLAGYYALYSHTKGLIQGRKKK
jgi:hypothetical protein